VRFRRSEAFTAYPSSLLSASTSVHHASRHSIAITAPPFLTRTYNRMPPPSAPPALHYSVSPYARIPLPPQSSIIGPVSLHPLLRAVDSSLSSLDPAIHSSSLDINLSSSPDAIRTVLMIATTEMFAPATQPPLPSMAITHPLLPWYIIVHRSVSDHVTVLDVLDTICRELSAAVGDEYRSQRRRKFELLQGRYRFRGLREVQRGEDVWELITSR
jgi:hypothetical protein